jgi:hypothetical protein
MLPLLLFPDETVFQEFFQQILKIIIFQISIRPSFGPLVFQPGPKNFMKFGVEISELQEQYSQHFIYFLTYQWAQ